jgi:subtilisin family serine protease
MRLSAFRLAAALLVLDLAVASAQEPSPAAKKKVNSANDLPRFSYPVASPPSVMLMADDATFNAFTQKVLHDVDSVLSDYDIQDKATLRQLYAARLNVQMLTGENEAALATCKELKALQEKPAAQAASGLLDRPLIEARIAAHANSGEMFLQSFQSKFKGNLNSLEWKLVQDRVKGVKGSLEIATPDLMVGSEKQGLDPAAAQTNSVDLAAAEMMIEDRLFVKVVYPLKAQALPVLTAYIAAHNVRKPDIWAAREVTLGSEQRLTPVRIGIWDSGVDTSLYPNQLFTDPASGAHSPHGLAFDMNGNIYNGDLQPLTEEQKALYPKMVGLEEGMSDVYNSIDSPAATDAKKMLASMPQDKVPAFMKQMGFLGQYMHGTHVAGIAVRGNPAARIVVAQFYDSLSEIPFSPTIEWANKFKADFRQVGEYFKANDVRVVNMSWGDDVAEFEEWLTKTSAEKDPAVRKQFAQRIFNIWREAIEGAIRSAPNTLFVCAAGNSNSDTGFTEDVPPSLHLPNLIAVGAVDQAGEETSFTSYGDTVVVHANGFQVESFVPGGTKLKFSGTSMSSPNVVNLAAKLIALDPSLTPEQTVDLMKRAADRSADGRINLINPKATVMLLKTQESAKTPPH